MIRLPFALPPVAAALFSAGIAAAETAGSPVLTLRYDCDRGVTVPATYVTTDDVVLVVIQVEGRQVTLMSERSASGARYGWPSDGAGYVWWTKGAEATLYWNDGEVEVPLLSCRQAE